MTSSRRHAANAQNAQRSTGPRTGAGKSRMRWNALKHGLAVPAGACPDLAPDLASLTQALAGDLGDRPGIQAAAARVAEATLDVLRARRAKTGLLASLETDPDFSAEAPPPTRPVRPPYSEAAYRQALRRGTGKQWLDAYVAALEVYHQQRTQRGGIWDQLCKLDRYERRALSRRKRAVKALDEACAATRHLTPTQNSSDAAGPATGRPAPPSGSGG